jgi:hypothetical protein
MPIQNKIDHAASRIPEAMDTPEEKVTAATTHIGAAKTSPSYGTATDVQKAHADWETENNNLDTCNKLIADLDSKLTQARNNRGSILRRWEVRRRAALNAVDAFCDGSKDMVKSFGYAVVAPNASPVADIPSGLVDKHSAVNGTAKVAWDKPAYNHGFMVQTASDPSNQATLSAAVHWTRCNFSVTGQTPGALVYIRVAALDVRLPSGQTAYSPWCAARVGG